MGVIMRTSVAEPSPTRLVVGDFPFHAYSHLAVRILGVKCFVSKLALIGNWGFVGSRPKLVGYGHVIN